MSRTEKNCEQAEAQNAHNNAAAKSEGVEPFEKTGTGLEEHRGERKLANAQGNRSFSERKHNLQKKSNICRRRSRKALCTMALLGKKTV